MYFFNNGESKIFLNIKDVDFKKPCYTWNER